jgi:RND family efflux transporter MFP subunit
VVLPGALLGMMAILLGYTARDALWPATKVQVIPVVVKSTHESAAASVVQAPGWVEPDPFPIGVAALTDGIVREVLVLEGQPVKEGDIVVRLVDDDAKLELAMAEAEVLDKSAALEAAQQQWDNPIERTRAVAAAEAQVAQTQAELKRNEAEVAAEQARAEELAAKVRRARQAFESNAATELEFIEADLQHKAQLALLQSAKARKPVLEAQLRERQAQLDAARKNLELRIEESQALKSAMAALDLAIARRNEAKLKLSRTEVRSPADGIVMNRFALPGAKLVMDMDDMHSAHAVMIYDPAKLQVRVDVPLADAAKVGVGQHAKIVVGVLPDKTFDGRVTRIVNEADIQKNTLQVKVAITNPSAELKPEMLARVRFLVPAEHQAHGANLVFAPQQLVQQIDGATKVWIADTTRGVAMARTVQLGDARQDGWVSVTSGLASGDLLIADPPRVREGVKITVVGEASEIGSTQPAAAKGGSHGAH